MTTTTPGAIEVTCRDLDTGETGTVILQPGQFVVCCAEPAHVTHDQAYDNGTNVVTVRRNRTAEPAGGEA